MNDKTKYTPLNLPRDLVEELRLWRQVFSASRGRSVTSAEMLRSVFSNMDVADPSAAAEMRAYLERHPELGDSMKTVTIKREEK